MQSVPHASDIPPHRVPDADLAVRLAANAELVEVARPHLEWLSAAHASQPHVVVLADRDGVVLDSIGTDSGPFEGVGALSGVDWSEARIGIEGTSDAPGTRDAAAVGGPEHFVALLHGCPCAGARVRGPGGEVVGAVGIGMAADPGANGRAVVVAHAAYAIERELGYRDALRRASGPRAAEQRLAEEHARRLAASEALRESEERFRGAFDHSAIGATITDIDGHWIRVNPALCEMLGYSEAELVSRPFQSLTHPDDLQPNLDLLGRALAGETDRYRLEKRFFHARGHVVWVQLNATLVRDAGGAPMYLLAQYQDVTERRRAESQLRAGEERYRRLVEAAHDGICSVDDVGTITFANARLARMLGTDTDDLVGRTLFDFMAPEVAFDARTRFARRLRGIAEVVEVALQRRDGTTLWTLESASSLSDGDGNFVGAVYLFTDVTDRHATQRRIEESEQHFRALTEQSSELVCVIGADSVLRYANPAFFRLLGYTPEESLGRSALDFVHPDDASRIAELLASLVAQPGAVISAEYGVRHHDGTRRVLTAIAQNLLADPAVGGIVVNAHDVSERRRAEEALRESETRFRHVVANAPGMVYQFAYRPDGSMGYTFVSEGARTIFGVAPEAALADPTALLDLIHPDEWAEFQALARATAGSLGPFRWEGRVVLPSGETRFVQIAARDQRHPDGSVVSDGLVMDLTELRRATQRLEESEQRYRSLFDQHPDAVFSLDRAGEFVSVNAAVERLTGFPREALLGRSFEPLIDRRCVEATLESFRAAVAGHATSYATTILNQAGSRIDLDVTNVPIVVGGEVVGVFGIARDLTGQRELEAQLRQAQKMEAVGRLAGGVAHDFNNLLTVITSYSGAMLAELPAEAAAREDLDEIQRAVDRAASLTRQLLAFSRQQMLQPRRIDVNRTVTDVAGMLRRVIGEDITLQTELAPGVWPVHADPGQLEQVLMNLAVNARDAMPEGGTLRLRTANLTVDPAGARERPGLVAGRYTTLIVEDTGTGIDPEVLPRIFEPFYTTKGVGQGTGLGLATVYGIVKQSGGYVYADSTPGEGSRFLVMLPPTEVAADAPATIAAPAPPRGTETILLVEDERTVRIAVRRTLERQGYTIIEAATGAEALGLAAAAEARGQRIDLVLTDVVMPEQNGRALGEELVAHWPTLRVLYMSGYTNDEILRRGLTEPGTAFLAKPFSPERLAEAVREALDGPRAGGRSSDD